MGVLLSRTGQSSARRPEEGAWAQEARRDELGVGQSGKAGLVEQGKDAGQIKIRLVYTIKRNELRTAGLKTQKQN